MQPHGGCPLGQMAGTQALLRQTSLHWQMPAQAGAEHVNRSGASGSREHVPVTQVPVHEPSQPSLVLQAAPVGQDGTHTQSRASALHLRPSGHLSPRPQLGPPGQALGTSA